MPIKLCDILGRGGAFARHQVREQTGIIELIEELFDGRGIVQGWREAPENLPPRGRRAVEQAASAWMTNKTAREALALALTELVNDGEITRARASELARMVLRKNAVRLYGLGK